MQAIPDEEEPTAGDNVSTGDQFSQRGRGAPEKRRSPEERLCQKLKESEASVDRSKFEPDSPDFDDEGTESSDRALTDNVSFQSTPNDSGEEEEQSVEQPGAAPIEERPTPKSRRGCPFKRAKSKELFRSNEWMGEGKWAPQIPVQNRWQWACKGPGACKTSFIVQGRGLKAPCLAKGELTSYCGTV